MCGGHTGSGLSSKTMNGGKGKDFCERKAIDCCMRNKVSNSRVRVGSYKHK